LDHLVSHASGDAYTSSALNTPYVSPNAFTNPISPVHNSPVYSTIPTSEPVDVEEPHVEPVTSELPLSDPIPSDVPSTSNTEHIIPPIPLEPEIEDLNPSPKHTPVYQGPSLDPNTSFSVYLPLYEDLLKDRINVNDDIIPPNLSKIKIINLKRKQPEPAIPFNQTQPFFNSLHEPNLELLCTATNLSLKRFKGLEEEQLIFPSDIDSEIMDLEGKFSESLRLLGGFVKERIKGRGMSVLRTVFEAAEHSNLLRITNFNHQEELLKQQQLLMYIQASIRTASQAVSVLFMEESLYEQALEAKQARIAAEAEYEKRAEQEALSLMVDRAAHIATIETQKLVQQQDVDPSVDTIMVEASPVISASDKGKSVPDGPSAPPTAASDMSPQKPLASEISPAVLAALEDIRHEMRDEIDILRADLREDSQRVGEATNKRLEEISGSTNKRLDDMMAILLQLTKNSSQP
jgi:hypothetical protein